LLYVSCHGIKDLNGILYFATSDTNRKLLRATAISANFVNEVMLESNSRRQVLLLDCCFSGAIARGMKSGDKDIHSNEQFQGRGRAVMTASDATVFIRRR
jgi:uncharacterized caspase-like protein